MGGENEDILLLKLIKQGDQAAFRHLFYQYVDSLERFANYYIHDREKAQELVLISLLIYGKTVSILK